jgi:hypothetical protein
MGKFFNNIPEDFLCICELNSHNKINSKVAEIFIFFTCCTDKAIIRIISKKETTYMKIFNTTLFFCICFLFFASLASAANNDTITVNYEVQAINELNIDGASVTLTVNAATAGAQPNQVTTSTTYDITTNCAADAKKLTAAINSDMPPGVTLKLNLTAPTGGTSPGDVTISSTPEDVITAIDAVAEANINMTFKMDATVSAGVVASDSKTLTLTLTDS